MDLNYAHFLLRKTREGYNFIASDYSQKRRHFSSDVLGLASFLKGGERVLDVGCANGRLISILPKVNYYGVDISPKFIEAARKLHPENHFQVASCLHLPFGNNFFDAIFSLAVFHHIPSSVLRLTCLREIRRVLKPDGFFFLRVWNFWRSKEGIGKILRYSLLKLAGQSKLDFADFFLPWKNAKGETIFLRYFHAFRKGELGSLLKRAGFTKIVKSETVGKGTLSNILFVVRK